MQTDSIFYELFRFDPQSLLKLVRLQLEGQYDFESITVKTTEKRFDGFLRRVDGEGPHLFLEVQGYPDLKIYWKLYREICTFYEQREDHTPFVAIVLYLDASFDPGEFGVTCLAPCQLLRVNLIDCLKALEGNTGTLTPLMPLTLKRPEELDEAIPRWKAEIRSLHLAESREKYLEELLINVLIQKFTDLTVEEINAMLNLTPIEQTTAGKQIFGIGYEQGMSKGISQGISQGLSQGLSKGELVGKIELAQAILSRPSSAKEELRAKSTEELSVILRELESEVFLKTVGHS